MSSSPQVRGDIDQIPGIEISPTHYAGRQSPHAFGGPVEESILSRREARCQLPGIIK